MDHAYQNLISECDALIKAGELTSVAARISKLPFAQIPREPRLGLAKICRRAGIITHGLRLLQPLIRQEKIVHNPASEAEIAEYAALLSRNGSIAEAASLLTTVDFVRTPEAQLYLGFCRVLTWDYASAAQSFASYLAADLPEYSKLVARVNLAAAYLATDVEATEFIEETIEFARSAGASRLIGNLLELRAQTSIRRADYSRASADLDAAAGIFAGSRGYDLLLIKKWRAVIAATQSGRVLPLMNFRKLAVRHAHWESVREADLFSLKIKHDQQRFDHLLFGSPMIAYRERVLKMLAQTPSDSFLFGQTPGTVLDLSANTSDERTGLNPGKQIHQSLVALSKDFYVARNTGTLFADLYPGEYFDVQSSPGRVRQAIRRSRAWLTGNRLPLAIVHSNGSYRLNFHGSFALKVSLMREDVHAGGAYWNELTHIFPPGRRFSAGEACRALQISRSSVHRICKEALADGRLISEGEGRAIRYRRVA